MKTESLIALLVWASIAIGYSLDLWIRPNVFLRRHQRTRAKAYGSWWGFLIRNAYFRTFDRKPGLELRWARITFLLIYAAILLVAFVALRS